MTQISAREVARHKAPPKRKRIAIEESDNGGYIVEHQTEQYPNPKHTFKNHHEMLKHVKAHMCPEEKGEKGEK